MNAAESPSSAGARRSHRWALALGATALVAGCASYRGSAVDATAAELSEANGWSVVSDVPFERQRDPLSCGPAALTMVLKHYGVDVRQEDINASAESRRSQAGELRDFARALGLSAYVFSGDVATIVHEVQENRPVIVGLAKAYENARAVAHYEVVVGFNASRGEVATLDPANGWRKNSLAGFLDEWKPTHEVMIAVLPHPPPPGEERPQARPEKADSIWDQASWRPVGP